MPVLTEFATRAEDIDLAAAKGEFYAEQTNLLARVQDRTEYELRRAKVERAAA